MMKNFTQPFQRKSAAAGFTLVEIMTVLAVATVLLAVGVPSFRTLIQNQRITTAVNDFFAAINLTRSEAIERGTRVDLMPVQGDKDWTKGWVVFIDTNNNHKPDSDEQIIFTHGPVPSGMKINGSFTDPDAAYLAYNGYGRTRTNADSDTPDAGSLSFSWDQQVRKIKINMLGRPRICDPAKDAANC